VGLASLQIRGATLIQIGLSVEREKFDGLMTVRNLIVASFSQPARTQLDRTF